MDDRLFFAGEACSRNDFSTAHGAYLTGIAAADQAIAARRGKRNGGARAAARRYVVSGWKRPAGAASSSAQSISSSIR